MIYGLQFVMISGILVMLQEGGRPLTDNPKGTHSHINPGVMRG